MVTPKLRWIVLKDVDIEGVIPYVTNKLYYIIERTRINSVPNPFNNGKLIHYGSHTYEPNVAVTVRHGYFNVSWDENSWNDYLNLLEEECEPVSYAERQLLCDVICSYRCPHFDRYKRDLLCYLAQ